MRGDIPVAYKEEKIEGIGKWEVSNALDTLCRAEEIKKNEKLMKAVKKLAQERMTEIAPLMAMSGDKK